MSSTHDPLPCNAVQASPGHRDVRAALLAAIPPRPAPLAKRVFWRLVLAIARVAPGRALLLQLRRRSGG
jgi:hypothetical protein